MTSTPAKRHAELTEVHKIIGELAPNDQTNQIITAIHRIPAREAEWESMPGWVRSELMEAYRAKGIERLYSHQAEATDRVHRGENVVGNIIG